MSMLPPVETVGYYSRDSQFNLVDSLKTELNDIGELALSDALSLIGKRITVTDNEDEEQHEDYMQSLLWFIGGYKEDLLSGVEVVTIRQVLASLATNSICNRIMAFRKYGIIWIVWYQEPEKQPAAAMKKDPNHHLARARAFENAIIEKPKRKHFQKTVNKVTLEFPGGSATTVLYSAETDAWRRGGDESVEIKSIVLDFDKFLRLRSQYCFWQSYFGNVKTILVGQLKTVANNVYSIREFSQFTPKSLLEAVRKSWNTPYVEEPTVKEQWSVEEGLDRVVNALKSWRDLMKNDRDKKVLKQKMEGDVIHWEEDKEAEFDEEFSKQVVAAMKKRGKTQSM